MARNVTTHLMFDGVAEEAMTLFVSLFGDSEIKKLERYGPVELGWRHRQASDFHPRRARLHLHGEPCEARIHLHAVDLPVR